MFELECVCKVDTLSIMMMMMMIMLVVAVTAAVVVMMMPDQYLGYRCEVQAPKTILYPMEVDLGTFYTGIPVHFDITTENICNLPTSYTLEFGISFSTGIGFAKVSARK